MKKAPEELRFAAMAVDIVIFGIIDKKLHVLVQNVNRPPHYVDIPGFPGGLIAKTETADDALARHLADKVHLTDLYTEQLYTFSAIDRDRRNRVISVGYIGCVKPEVIENYMFEGALWMPVSKIKKLAYDHDAMFTKATARLRGKLAYTTIAQFLLPKSFTLTQLQDVYEVILGTELDKRNFRKKIIALDIVKETGRMQEGVKNRPAALYSYVSKNLKQLPSIVWGA
ncbi:MAG: 8-oxo-dGTP diphosphatase [Patiriisocius sp.]|jgi:8-oxo-dGTP diphosphatase